MNLIDRIMRAVKGALAAEIEGITPNAGKQRAMHLDVLYDQLWRWASDQLSPYYVVSLYVEESGELYALFGRDGRLFRAEVSISDTTINVGELEEVKQEFEPVSRSSFTLRELPNGDVRFFMVAATAVVNRVGEIDSTSLFDNMVRRAEELSFYPRLDVYHLGSLDPLFEFGEFDFLARDGVSYIASGIMDGSHPLTKQVLRQYKTNPKSLGASIEYYPIVNAYEDLEIGGATIRAYVDGINTRISILFEQDAAGWFTSMTTGDLTMQQRQLDDATKAKLRKLFGDDEDAMNKFLGNVEGISRAVDELGLVHRDAGQDEQPAAEVTATELVATQEVELTDEIVEIIARRVAEIQTEQFDAKLAVLNGAIEKVSTGLASIGSDLDRIATTQRQITDRLTEVEQDENAKRREWLADVPAGKQPVRVGYRPRDERKPNTEVQRTSDDIASATLANIPGPFGKS